LFLFAKEQIYTTVCINISPSFAPPSSSVGGCASQLAVMCCESDNDMGRSVLNLELHCGAVASHLAGPHVSDVYIFLA
jgi:hypothetical protein